MKKKILLLIGLLLFTSACSSRYLKNINLTTLNEKLEQKETFILYLTDEDDIGNTLKNTLTKVAEKNDIKSFYLNTSKLNDNDLDSLKEKITFEDSNIIIFLKEGKEESVLTRINNVYISEKDLEAEFKAQGFIK